MAVDAFEKLYGHPDEAGRFSDIDAALHDPGCGGMAKNVRSDVGPKTCVISGATEGLIYTTDGRPVELHSKTLGTV